MKLSDIHTQDIAVRKGQRFVFFLKSIPQGPAVTTEPELATQDISHEKMDKWTTESLGELANQLGVDYEDIISGTGYDYGWKII